MPSRKTPIKYTSREFDSIKRDLVEHAKRYYPETYRDFGAASMGSMYLGAVSYVGDMLSFYLDYQVNELFLETATEYDTATKGAPVLSEKLKFMLLYPLTLLGLVRTRTIFLLLRPEQLYLLMGDQFLLPLKMQDSMTLEIKL